MHAVVWLNWRTQFFLNKESRVWSRGFKFQVDRKTVLAKNGCACNWVTSLISVCFEKAVLLPKLSENTIGERSESQREELEYDKPVSDDLKKSIQV